MKISVLMPTYNDRESILETFESVKKQNYSNWELIVVDDGSSDDTKSVVNEYIKKYDLQNKITYIYQQNQDQLNAIINGTNYITGDYVYILHSDDLVPDTETFSKLVETANKNKEIDAFIGDLIVIDENSKQTGIQKVDEYNQNEDILATLMLWLGRNLYADFMFAKKEVFITKIQETYLTWNMPFWTDFEGNKKILNIKNLDFPILKYRVHDGNYINNDIGKLNVINGELRTLTRLMKYYNIPNYNRQFIKYRVFNKLGIRNKFKVRFTKEEQLDKGHVVEFVIKKRFEDSYKENRFLDSVVKFYKSNSKRKIELPKVKEEDKIYKGKDMRAFNNDLLNGNIPDIYMKMFEEMSVGFDTIVVKDDKELEIANNIAKFLCIYQHVNIQKI